jgi:hypothetical protein
MMMSLGLVMAAGSGATPILLDADSDDVSHFTKSTDNISGKVNFLATEKGYAIRPHSSLIANPTNEAVSRSFLSVYGKHFGLKNEASELVASKIKTTKDGRNISRFKQVYPCVAQNPAVQGGDVSGSTLLLHNTRHVKVIRSCYQRTL